MMPRWIALVAIAAHAAAGPLLAGDAAWLEGEAPSAANFKPEAGGWGNKSFLSGESWVHLALDADKVEKGLPDGGAVLKYTFAAGADGPHEVWARVGFEFARSAFEWRLDGGDWARVAPDELTTDLMEIAFFCEVAWLKLGDRPLAKGEHAIEIRLPKVKGKDGKYERVLFALDALCVDPGHFAPNSKFKPGDDGRDAADRKAGEVVFRLPDPGPGGARSAIALAGTWEICRHDEQQPGEVAAPIADRPGHPAWRAIAVPGDKNVLRPDLVFAHRVWYRTRVEVPAAAAGRSFHLVFPQNNLNTTVVVNGIPCGFDKNPFARVEMDVTKGIRPGVNEILVGIRDAWYGRAADPANPLRLRKTFNLPKKFFNDGFQDLAYPVWGAPQSGILATPEFVCAGPAYAADVFCKPSVARKELAVEVTVANPGDRAISGTIRCEAVDASGKVAKGLPPAAFSLDPRGAKAVAVAGPWADPQLWWPDRPAMYRLRTTIEAGGKALDVSETPFGFREWAVDGIHFTLNGVPFHGWTGGGDEGTGPDDFLAHYKKENQKTIRFWGTTWKGLPPDPALDFFDRSGVVVRRSGILDGEAIGYYAVEPDEATRKKQGSELKLDLMRNWRDQVVAQVRGERNHPSVMLWSIENEWLFINCINLYGGLMDQFEAEVLKASDAVRAVDPTRPTMTDGGGANKDQSMPVHGSHYITGPWTQYPKLAYEPNVEGGGRGRWTWDKKRPRFVGEDFFMTGNHPELAYFGGEAAFLGKQGTGPATGLALRMLQEGYRWADFGAWHFWLGLADTDGQHLRSYADRAVFCRQWDWTFGSGQAVTRTLGIFNDTHEDSPITLGWTLAVGGKVVDRHSSAHRVAPGTNEKLDVALRMPKVAGRAEGEWSLELRVGGKSVYRDAKAISVLDDSAALADARKVGAGRLLVYDPAGSVSALFKQSNVPFTPLASLDALPPAGKVLVVGKDALSEAESTSSRLAAYAADGRGVVVLEQRHPLKHRAFPAAMEAASNEGRTAFGEDLEHPALRGLQQKDFFTWGPDEVVYRDAYAKPTRGAKSLVQCDNLLQNSALVEVPVGRGVLLLSQLVAGEKLVTNAVARQLVGNLVGHAAAYRLEFRPVAAAVAGAPQLAKALDAIGLKYAAVSDPMAAISAADAIAIVAATPANLKALASHAEEVGRFTRSGGWIVLNGLTPEGLADYNRLVGFDHMIRPFRRERVSFPALKSRLTSGLTAGDVVLYSSEPIFPWTAGNYVVSDEFSHVVDLDDVAPFAQFPDDFLRNMVNGFVSADAWKFIVNVPAPDHPPLDWVLRLPRPQEIREVEWIGNTFYYPVTRFELVFDGKESVSFSPKPNNDVQTFRVDPPRTGTEITLRLADWEKVPGKAQVTGLDNLRLFATRPADFAGRVRPMLNVGGLVEYPRGAGGIVLANLLFKDAEEVPENAGKKRTILGTILRNLKAPFSGGLTVIAGANLDYRPIDLSKQANQYRTDRGWFGDPKFTFKDLPTGRRTFAGVPFEVYDFPTSPVPTVVMLAGANVPNNPAAEVRGIPVGGKADALFFLQAARIDRRRDAQELKEKKAPELARYVVTYADGTTAEVPVRAEVDVDDFKQAAPAALPGAQVAWTRPYDGAGASAVAYAQQWDNPRPDVPIRSIGVVRGAGADRGVLALIAVTAAAARP